MINAMDYFFKELSEKIAEVDFTGYTFQYPPMIFWKKISEEEVKKSWRKILKKLKSHLGMYVHFPYCKTRCSFCRYFSNKLRNMSQINVYLNFLEKEENLYKYYLKAYGFKTLYIGGGTPSLMSLKQISSFFEKLYKKFNFSECVQIAFEGNIDFLDYKKLKALKYYGVNRLTIGVQSLDEKVIRNTNRTQNSASFYRIYQSARKVGIKYINIDLMTGLPGQSIRSFSQTIKRVVKLKPDMVHIHPFYPTSYTQFFKEGYRLSRYQMDNRGIMSRFGRELLLNTGYKKIKFDALGLTSLSRNRQLSDNIEGCAPILGLGSGAASYNTGYFRYVNFNDINKYYKALTKKILPIYKGYKLSRLDDMIYFTTAALRYGQVDKYQFKKIFSQNIDRVFQREIEYLKNRGKITDNKRYILSKMSNIGEYLIFSKYFYRTNLIDIFKRKYHIEERRLTKEDSMYMLI